MAGRFYIQAPRNTEQFCAEKKPRCEVASGPGRGYQWPVPTVGEQLKQAREAQKLGIHEIVDLTKIRGDHIRSLEAGNYSVFSAPVYIRGFVRTYASLLHLDTAKILEQLGRELADSGQIDPTLSPPERSSLDAAMFQLAKFSRRIMLPAMGVVVALAVILTAFLLARHYRNQDPTARLGESFYPAPTNTGDTLPLPPVH
jgi:cytoskeletal protein RodZ